MHDQRLPLASRRIPGMDVIWHTPNHALGPPRVPTRRREEHTAGLKGRRDVNLFLHAIHRDCTDRERDFLQHYFRQF